MRPLGERDRTQLIGEIASVLNQPTVPPEARQAALTLIGWLARRMPGEPSPEVIGPERTGR